MNLLIDLGNSRLKWGAEKGKRIGAGKPVIYGDHPVSGILYDIWGTIDSPEQIAISCVSAETRVAEICRVANDLWPGVPIIRAYSVGKAFGVTNAYPQPEKLGVDRWLCLLALQHNYDLPACVVDCGTAMTIDVLGAGGKHQGGVIMPGLRLMKQALFQGAIQLPFSETEYQAGLADNTEGAIFSGTLLSAAGLIERVITEFTDETMIIMTGGDAEEIARLISEPVYIEPDLVLQGLSVLLEKR